IADRAREALAGGEDSLLTTMVQGRLEHLMAQHVYEASKKGDDVAREVVRETARFIGTGVANLINIFNPNVVVLEGLGAQAGEDLFGPLRAEGRRRAFKLVVEWGRIGPGEFGVAAGVVGA